MKLKLNHISPSEFHYNFLEEQEENELQIVDVGKTNKGRKLEIIANCQKYSDDIDNISSYVSKLIVR